MSKEARILHTIWAGSPVPRWPRILLGLTLVIPLFGVKACAHRPRPLPPQITLAVDEQPIPIVKQEGYQYVFFLEKQPVPKIKVCIKHAITGSHIKRIACNLSNAFYGNPSDKRVNSIIPFIDAPLGISNAGLNTSVEDTMPYLYDASKKRTLLEKLSNIALDAHLTSGKTLEDLEKTSLDLTPAFKKLNIEPNEVFHSQSKTLAGESRQ